MPVPIPVVIVESPKGGGPGARAGRSQAALKPVIIGTFGPIIGTFLYGQDTYIRQKKTSDQGIDRYNSVLCGYTDRLITRSYLVLKPKLNRREFGVN